jgi:hypothetical protein
MMSAHPYRSAEPVDVEREVDELIALGQTTGLFATPAVRRRVLVRQGVHVVIAIAFIAALGWNVISIYSLLMSAAWIVAALDDDRCRRKQVRLALQNVPSIEPPSR